MKRNSMIGAAVLATAMLAGGSLALAEEPKGPEVGSWEYQQALETGTLPPEHHADVSTAGPAGRQEGQQTIASGGLAYRIGVDMP